MAKQVQPRKPASKSLATNDLSAGIKKLNRRIDELSNFDVNTIEKRFDSKGDALANKVNSTLADIFGRDTPEYNDYYISSLDDLPIRIGGGDDYSLHEIREAHKNAIDDEVLKLTTLRETLEEKLEDLRAEDMSGVNQMQNDTSTNKKRVFVVHGHDEAAEALLARFIIKMELEPVILHEQPNKSRTIIEKLEAYKNVDYAVVLLTPDDVGYPKDKPEEKKPRARQNVILELGLFLGSIGRSKLCALYKEGVELPSDYDGVMFIQMDDTKAWEFKLAREIKEAGIDIDMNNL